MATPRGGGVRSWCGMAMSRMRAGVEPARVAASHGPGIEPCGEDGNGIVDA